MMNLIYRILFLVERWKLKQKYNIIRKRYKINSSFRFNGKDIFIYGKGKIVIGKNSYIGSLSTIQLHEKATVLIGRGCSISHNVRMYTSSKIPDYDFTDKLNIPDKIGNIEIGDYCWIGSNVLINPGVIIGENAVVGANSVVTKDIPPYTIYGGVPAKFIRKKRKID